MFTQSKLLKKHKTLNACFGFIYQKQSEIYKNYKHKTHHPEKVDLALMCNRWDGTIGLPGGRMEEDEGFILGLKRELKEEAGVVSTNFIQLGEEIHLSNSHSNERALLYLATDLKTVPAEPEGCSEDRQDPHVRRDGLEAAA